MPRLGFHSLVYSIGLISLSTVGSLQAQTDPGAREDEKAARQKLLRAADQIDAIQAASDSQTAQLADLKTSLAQQRTDLDSLRAQIAALKDENAALRATLAKLDAARAEERKTLLDEVGKIVADGSKHAPAPSAPAPSPTKETASPTPASTDGGDANSEKGFDYVVVKGDTLHAIATAYTANGVHVTVADLRKANNLGKDEAIHVGQKLFIPKK